MIKKLKGFTLAEVLITLGIIGVVAAVTIPTLINSYKEKVIVNRLKNTYAVLSQAYNLAVVENGEIERWDIGPLADNYISSEKLYNIFKPHMKLIKDCGSKGCFSNDTYKALDGKTAFAWQPSTHSVYAKVQLLNESSLAFWSNGKCSEGSCGAIMVDINGSAPPNQAGLDYFRFDITTSGIVPSSPVSTKYGTYRCEYQHNGNVNGANCTKWVIKKGNLDYLKRNVSDEMSKL